MITGKLLIEAGWPQDKVIGQAVALAAQLSAQGLTDETLLLQLESVRQEPEKHLDDTLFAPIARSLHQLSARQTSESEDKLRDKCLEYKTWGADGIEPAARAQMRVAMRLPVTVAGALMPDAHVGYGLPIGGVLATHETVIPYAVGVDIACRMRLSIYDASPKLLLEQHEHFKDAILNNTAFGSITKLKGDESPQHPVLDDPDWKATRLLRILQQKAAHQLGTSGSGNHFVEWGAVELANDSPALGLKAGTYLGLLSHSGSRAVGFKIANEYSRIARERHPHLADEARQLSWLALDSEAGCEYWLSMELAGRFASANHFVIHQRVAQSVGLNEIAHVENHHNFAWRETLANGEEAIVHRKGATPAGLGVLGVIPGSMAAPGYVVQGRGIGESISSASHGAGRLMGRRAAVKAITEEMRDQVLQEQGVTRLGGGIDESPQAYKDIESVIAAQSDLVDIVAKFTPRIVRMADEAGAF